jgi:hypothetical protein
MTASRGMTFQIVAAESETCVAIFGHVLILCYGTQVTMESLVSARKAHEALASRYPDGIGSLTLADRPRIDEACLREAVKLTRDTHDRVRWSACVLTSDGFVASAARAGLTTVLTLSGQANLVRVFREMQQAMAWQAQHPSGLGVPIPELTHAANRAQQHMLAHRSVAG